MIRHILAADLTSNTVIYSAAAVGIFFFALLFMRPGKRWMLRALAGVGVGGLLGVLILWVTIDVWDVLKVGVKYPIRFWFVAAFVGLGLASVSFRRSPRWRKLVAAISIPVFVLTATVGINGEFGLNRTLASVFGISSNSTIDLPKHDDGGLAGGDVPLWKSWKPPADMPATGSQGDKIIPNTTSGFVARPAGIYLPPAAGVANAPRLPLVIMMMGQPGNPDTQFIAATLDKFAAAHNGLAPIVVVADQIGPEQNDTLCLDTKQYGNVESYIIKDVLDFAKSNLHILEDPRYWTIGGYSNGGQCAISLAAKFPNIFKNVLDISGEQYPGAEYPDATLAEFFGGDQAAYDAQKPINIMDKRKYPDTTAIFTAGSDDTVYVAAAKEVAAAAGAAGMSSTYYEVPNGGHVIAALNGGLEKGFEVLYPRLGLSP
ncbi:esterase [Arthrobacter alpinus]|uniref:Esterase n=1 Tax=Arthrobacter alpinus TaxID=656366 RepID=A0A0M3UGK0_9MICC|nr:alpha/beta hydrolase-fold protein [Arthrobacter alpinus]ALE93245.1 esterase [Arthrobacter alpinus]